MRTLLLLLTLTFTHTVFAKMLVIDTKWHGTVVGAQHFNIQSVSYDTVTSASPGSLTYVDLKSEFAYKKSVISAAIYGSLQCQIIFDWTAHSASISGVKLVIGRKDGVITCETTPLP